jgi:hypothetical protein
MRNGIVWVAIILLFVGVFGCHPRNTKSSQGSGGYAGTPANSIDGYAKEHGISREEAAKRMRAQLVPPGESNAERSPIATSTANSETQNK